MEYAEVYMLLLRKTTMAPVVGEAMGEMFWGQIDLNGWTFNLANEERISKLKSQDRARDHKLEQARNDRDKAKLDRERQRLMSQVAAYNKGGKQALVTATLAQVKQIDKQLTSLKEGIDPSSGIDKDLDKEEGNPLKFTFEKRVDTASTQMLNMMKGGVPFEKAVVTIVHRAGIISKIPGLLSLQFSNLLLTNYELTVTQDETGTELKESWDAEFTHVMFEYSRRMDPL